MIKLCPARYLIERILRRLNETGFPEDTPVEVSFRFRDNDDGDTKAIIGTLEDVEWSDLPGRGPRIELLLVGYTGCQRDQEKKTVTFSYDTAEGKFEDAYNKEPIKG